MKERMVTDGPPSGRIQAVLAAKLAESLSIISPETTPRTVSGSILMPGKATAIIGIRRSGKTTFMHQLRRERARQGVPMTRLPSVSFEDERLSGISAQDMGPLVEEYYRLQPEGRGKETVLWCFDEIQVVQGWERFIRRFLDSEKVDVVVTGSSAALLGREIATALRGRAWEVLVHPFSFSEVLRHTGRVPPERPSFMTPADRSDIESTFLDYLRVGGFPEAQGLHTADRTRLLSDYVDVAMLRDVVERHSVTNVAGLRWLVRHLMSNAAASFSGEKFYAALRSQGFAISKDTVHALLSYLEDCFLVRMVWMEATSERQRMVNPRKAYPADPGLIPVFDRSGRANTGHALETVVLLELERRRYSVTYVRTREGHEVDFLARHPDGEAELIQVCANAADLTTAQRELSALLEAGRVHPEATRRLLTLTQDGIPDQVPKGITAQPAYEWLLTP